jgi:hypothetical protein
VRAFAVAVDDALVTAGQTKVEPKKAGGYEFDACLSAWGNVVRGVI